MRRQMIAIGFAVLLPLTTAVAVVGGATLVAAAISVRHRHDPGR